MTNETNKNKAFYEKKLFNLVAFFFVNLLSIRFKSTRIIFSALELNSEYKELFHWLITVLQNKQSQ